MSPNLFRSFDEAVKQAGTTEKTIAGRKMTFKVSPSVAFSKDFMKRLRESKGKGFIIDDDLCDRLLRESLTEAEIKHIEEKLDSALYMALVSDLLRNAGLIPDFAETEIKEGSPNRQARRKKARSTSSKSSKKTSARSTRTGKGTTRKAS